MNSQPPPQRPAAPGPEQQPPQRQPGTEAATEPVQPGSSPSSSAPISPIPAPGRPTMHYPPPQEPITPPGPAFGPGSMQPGRPFPESAGTPRTPAPTPAPAAPPSAPAPAASGWSQPNQPAPGSPAPAGPQGRRATGDQPPLMAQPQTPSPIQPAAPRPGGPPQSFAPQGPGQQSQPFYGSFPPAGQSAPAGSAMSPPAQSQPQAGPGVPPAGPGGQGQYQNPMAATPASAWQRQEAQPAQMSPAPGPAPSPMAAQSSTPARKKRHFPWLAVLITLVVGVGAGVVGTLFYTGDIYQKQFAQDDLQKGVYGVLNSDFGFTSLEAKSVSCPEHQVAKKDATFECTFTYGGDTISVPVTVINGDGQYRVGSPKTDTATKKPDSGDESKPSEDADSTEGADDGS